MEQPLMGNAIARTVRAAVQRGIQPVPIRGGDKRPAVGTWTKLHWTNDPEGIHQAIEKFDQWQEEGATNIGVLLGEPSGDLVDIDLDYPVARRLADFFLPPTAMRSGRAGNPSSHYWYRTTPGTLPGNRRHKMPDRSMIVELRSTGSQTVVPPSVHPNGEQYRWEGRPWGGAQGPSVVDGQVLAAQVALLALGTVLIDCWPARGTRHEAYLALAGGLLWHGEGEVHPFWSKNASVLIRALAEATHDDDGPDAREREVIDSTLAKIKSGANVVGLGRLAALVGDDYVRTIRRLIGEVEAEAGFQPRNATTAEPVTPDPSVAASGADSTPRVSTDLDERLSAIASEIAALPPEERDPMSEREVIEGGTWQAVDLDPFLAGQITAPTPDVFARTDGEHLMYRGRVNMLYGSSETAKSWIALQICLQEITEGGRALYIDFEDEPISTLSRLKALGAGLDDIRNGFTYIRPEGPLAPMQRTKWGQERPTNAGVMADDLFKRVLAQRRPTVIVLDGMTVLYALHGLDTNDNVSTEYITGWTRSLTDNGNTTVIIIDHSAKSSEKGSLPIGSGHKQAMVQGTLLQIWLDKQPMPGALGRVEAVVIKDRPGEVRKVSAQSGNGNGKAQVAAVITIDSRPKGDSGTPRTLIQIDPPPSKEQIRAQTSVSIDLTNSRAAEKAAQSQRAVCVRDAVLRAFGGEVGRSLLTEEVVDRIVWPFPDEPGPQDSEVLSALKLLTGTDPDAYLEQRKATNADWPGDPEARPKNWARGSRYIWTFAVQSGDETAD